MIEEIDWSVGQLLSTLAELGIQERTIVWFTSDNGPWLSFESHGGSAGLLREGKGMTWEGGMRVPTIAWWPGKIAAGQTQPGLGSTMDIYTTSLKLAGAELPEDRLIDGYDLTGMLTAQQASPRDVVHYYRGTRLMAIRKGPWKAHFVTQGSYVGDTRAKEHDPPLLYQLEHDPGEQRNLADQHPEVIADLIAAAQEHQQSVEPVKLQLEVPTKR